jgi:hypothetical protein
VPSATDFGQTPTPQPADPSRPRRRTASAAAAGGTGYTRTDALRDYHELALTGHAFWILATHGIAPNAVFPFDCALCGKPWRCPEVVWAADWIIQAHRHGVLDQHGLRLGNDCLAVIKSWGSEPALAADPEPV